MTAMQGGSRREWLVLSKRPNAAVLSQVASLRASRKGIMNLFWIIGLTIYVWVEKILPGGELISRLMGGLLALWGLGLLTGFI